MMSGYGMGYGHMAFGWIFQIAILVLFFSIIWWILRGANCFGFKVGNETALDILKKRLAAGEITEQEYHKLRKEIEK